MEKKIQRPSEEKKKGFAREARKHILEGDEKSRAALYRNLGGGGIFPP